MIATTIRAAWLHALNKPSEAPRRFWLAVKAIVAYRFTKPSTLWEVIGYNRLHLGCHKCEIFDRKWGACGDGKTRLSNGDFVGCLCDVEFKTKIPTATCWLHDQGVTDKGWPKEQ